MNFRGKIGIYSLAALFGIGGPAAVTAQEVDDELRSQNDTAVVDTTGQEVDYSKIEVDSIRMTLNGEPIAPAIQQYLTSGKEFDDAQDVYDFNNDIQWRLAENDPTLTRILPGGNRSARSRARSPEAQQTQTPVISVEAYHEGEQVAQFDADDMSETKPNTEAEQQIRRRTRGGDGVQRDTTGTQHRSRSRNPGGGEGESFDLQ